MTSVNEMNAYERGKKEGMPKTKWIIWSIEHGCWWRANSQGYCAELKGAGVYSYERALEIVKGANYSLTLEKPKKHDIYLNTPHEAMILITPELASQIDNAIEQS